MLAMTSGRSLLGDAPPKPLRVWYWGEDPADEIDRRVLGAMKHYGIDPGEIEGRLFLNSAADTKLKIAIEKSGSFTIVSPIVDSLIDEFRSKSIDVAIVDPFVKTHGVQENDNGGIDQVVDLWASIARETNSAIDLIHHLKKLGGAEVTIDDVRGASAIVGAVRAVRLYAGMSEAEAKETNTENRRAFFKRRNGKANYFLPSDKWDWFLLENISLENGGDGPSDEVGVAVNWKWPNALDGLSVDDLRKVQQKIAEGEWRENIQASNWAGNAVAQALSLDARDDADKARIKRLLKTWIANKALKIDTRYNAEKSRDAHFVVVGERV